MELLKSEGMAKLDDIKRSQAKTLEKKVLALLKTCRQNKSVLSDEALREEFESMWKETLSEIKFRGLTRGDVAQDAFSILRDHLSTRSGYVNNMLVENSLVNYGKIPFIVESVDWWQKTKGFVMHLNRAHSRMKLQELCDYIITQCQDFITQPLTE